MKASELLLQSATPFDEACVKVLEMERELNDFREAAIIFLDFYNSCQLDKNHSKHYGATTTNFLAVKFTEALGLSVYD